MKVKITDNSKEVLAAMRAAAVRALEKCGLVAEGYAKRLCPVDTGNLRNSISHTVDGVDGQEPAAYIGTNVEYGVYQEFGTGKYYPGGRDTPWIYTDLNGETHWTMGNRAKPFLRPAVADHQGTYKSIIAAELKG